MTVVALVEKLKASHGRVLFVGLRRWVEGGKEDDKKAGKKRKKS